MLNAEQVEEVRRLLRRGKSSRAIARHTGISRATIATIRQGKWAPAGRTRKQVRDAEDTFAENYDPARHGIAHRCGECGGKILTRRCLACDVKAGRVQPTIREA